MRGFKQSHVDGNDANVERCSNSADPQFRNTLCLQDDGFPRPDPVTPAFRDQFAILDQNNNPIPCPPGNGNTCAGVPYGTIDRTSTNTTTIGGAAQATEQRKDFRPRQPLHGRRQHRSQHASISRRRASSASSIRISSSRSIRRFRATARSSIRSADFGYGPVGLDATTTYYGLYATDTFDITRNSRSPPARGSMSPRSRWPISSAPVPSSTAARPIRGSIRSRA